jgi:hypothetical protein
MNEAQKELKAAAIAFHNASIALKEMEAVRKSQPGRVLSTVDYAGYAACEARLKAAALAVGMAE